MGLINYLGASLLSGLIAVTIMLLAYYVIDHLTPEIDYVREVQKGNLAVGIVLAGLFIGLGLAISGAF